MALTYFPVTGIFKAVVSDASDAAGDPDVEGISSFVYFSPSTDQVYSSTDLTIYRLPTIRCRTNSIDGVLKNIDDTAPSLVANTPELGLEELVYTVSFDHVVYDEREQIIKPFKFVAPTDSTPVDLATVDRVP
jgi:hypothetical protein